MTESLVHKRFEYTFAVSGKEPMAVAFNPKSGMFDPEFVNVVIEQYFGEKPQRHVDITVHGPELRNGKRLKTKRGHQRYDLEYFETGFLEEQPPVWVFDIARGLGLIPPQTKDS